MRRTLFSLAGAALAVSTALAQSPRKPAPQAPSDFFTQKVQPILQQSCIACHSGASASGGLDLSDRAALLKGGVSGPGVDPARPAASLLLRAVRHDGRKMPPQGKLPPGQIETLTRWVAMGTPWSARARPKPDVFHQQSPPVNEATKRFWAFQPIRRPAIPKVRNAAWVKNPVDAFVLAKLEKNGLSPAPPAARPALLRRVSFDLTGLPPTPEEVRAFLMDPRPDAYERVVDRLLASPHYGERWGRHWLDLVRYAETNSYERDGDKPFVWRYRDYVIRAFNDDKPYDQFVREQLAGDELPGDDPDPLIATGFYRLGLWDDEPSDPEQARFDDLDDIVSTVGQTFLGLTVGCARCHEHKIDPMPQRDYYRLLAFFANLNRYGDRSHESVLANSVRPISPPDEQRRYAAETAAYNAQMETLQKALEAIEKPLLPDFQEVEKQEFQDEFKRPTLLKRRVPRLLSAEKYAEYERLTAERNRLRAAPPKPLEQALCVTERGSTAPKTFVLARGSAAAPTDEVQPGFLSVLSPPEPVLAAPAGAKSAGRRLALANWLVDPRNPLPARVMANRLFQHHFGRGIVRSASNFGFLGTPPTHPELLDYLARELIEGGWKLKRLHRLLLLSNAYQMSSRPHPAARAKDPENDLLWRFDMRRLDAEEIRDAILSANGTLNPRMFGPSVLVTLPREVLAGQSVPGAGWGESPAEEQTRRSVYVKIKRSLAVPLFANYDMADTDAHCPVRFATTQPTQALGMMNSAFVNQQATLFSAKARREAGADPANQVRWTLWRTLQRPPTTAEVQRGVNLIRRLQADDRQSAEEALAAFCLVALNLNEFAYLD